ncbi:MAG: chalcone isomerase family protein [Rubrivivax sp.]|nr:chalcone isomerase family protein [Rubrivivax sp.]
MTLNRRALIAALATAPALAWAQAAGPVAPAEVRLLLGAAARLRGAARLRMWGLSIYEARLWVPEGFEPQRFDARPMALELIYARSLKGPLIAERSIEEMRRGEAFGEAEARRWLSFMNEVFPNVAEGDRLTGTWDPASSTTGFHFNGGDARTLRDPAFGPRFFGIWLASHSSQPAMRQKLLGLNG